MSSHTQAAPSLPPGVPEGGFATADAWRGVDLADGRWRCSLTPAELGELMAARDHARSRSRDMYAWTRADFPLPTLAGRIAGWMQELDRGRGFVLVRGVPVDRLGESACAEIYWGLGLHMGRAVSQNTDGDLIGHIRDTGADPNAYTVCGSTRPAPNRTSTPTAPT